MTDTVHLGVIGAGYWGRKLVYEYLSVQCGKGNVQLAGVRDSCPSALASCKEKFSVKCSRSQPELGQYKIRQDLQMMFRLGLIRTTAMSEGVQYEVTESGLHFLKEYGEIEHDVTKAPTLHFNTEYPVSGNLKK